MQHYNTAICAEAYWNVCNSLKYLNYILIITTMKRKLEKVGGLNEKKKKEELKKTLPTNVFLWAEITLPNNLILFRQMRFKSSDYGRSHVHVFPHKSFQIWKWARWRWMTVHQLRLIAVPHFGIFVSVTRKASRTEVTSLLDCLNRHRW